MPVGSVDQAMFLNCVVSYNAWLLRVESESNVDSNYVFLDIGITPVLGLSPDLVLFL
jgi:hypothetical protein